MNKTLRNYALVALAVAPFSAFAEIVGAGTAEDPYLIATPEDLTFACRKVMTSETNTIYFAQTNDIDMSGVKDYFALNGTYSDYTKAIVYDGRNHVISNFAPNYVEDGGDQGYYNGSIFGVLIGKVMNLGVVDAKVDMKGYNKTAGILGAYFGHGNVLNKEEFATSVIENVYVTGEIIAGNYNTGGMFGTTGSPVEIRNCFTNIKYTGTGGNMGGVIGRVHHDALMECCYVAGTVNAEAGLIAGGGNGTLTVDGVVVFNTGSNKVCSAAMDGEVTLANTLATRADGVEEVKSWSAFSTTEEVDGLPALKYVLSGEGTQANPYVIASASDLANAYRFVDCVAGGDYYFVQTADIDMTDVEDYHALAGYNGCYAAVIHYDGRNHIISNFAPNAEEGNVAETDYYYCTSLFGVPSGEIKNLGVVDAYVSTAQGAGILGAYAGHGSGSELLLENVFVHGTVEGAGGYTGGMFGTTGNEVTMVNCFANVEVTGASYAAALIGRLRNQLNLEQVYVAGTVDGGNAALVCATDKAPEVSAFDVVAFNTGADVVFGAGINVDGDVEVATDDTKEDLIAEVAEWDGFTDQLFEGYPLLEGFNAETTGIVDAAVETVEANGPAVYYNLQGVQVANPDNGIYIVRRGSQVTKEMIRK